MPAWPCSGEYLRVRLRCEPPSGGRAARTGDLRLRLRYEPPSGGRAALTAAAAWPRTLQPPHRAWALPEASPGPLQQSLAQLLHAAVHVRNRSRGIAEHQPMTRLAVAVLHR